jgi:hypothetical protein
VAPAELEGCLLDHQDVADCCVVGFPDSYAGELPLAYIVLSAEATQRSKIGLDAAASIRNSIFQVGVFDHLPFEPRILYVLQHVSERKAPYKHLKGGICFVEQIPVGAHWENFHGGLTSVIEKWKWKASASRSSGSGTRLLKTAPKTIDREKRTLAVFHCIT